MFCIDTSYLLEIILSIIWKKRENNIWIFSFIIKTVTLSIFNIFTCPIRFRHLKMLKRWVGKKIYIWSNFVLTQKCYTLLKYAYIYIYIYIQSWPKRLTHYGFWKIIAFGSKNGFKMGEQCYHIVEYVVLII